MSHSDRDLNLGYQVPLLLGVQSDFCRGLGILNDVGSLANVYLALTMCKALFPVSQILAYLILTSML